MFSLSFQWSIYCEDRSRPVFSCSPEVIAQQNKLKAWVAMSESLAEKYQSPPPPVDFVAAAKNVRDQDLVKQLQTFYQANQPPPEKHVMTDEERARSAENLAYLKELDALHKEFVPVMQEEINFMVKNRTTVDTTIHDWMVAYPAIHEEIEDELERREWFKDAGWGRK
jgi:hypothetical protein